ncbi:hypothetical protein N7495_004066 [Penicillium taxi]|uniref:uncharacterized protein n=1 Tax=Penicillium taxi TaxID=168475 RepID=UPI002544E83C|nr:uncharacterized protein N7495_004066 [Penicillium taxi]KAJ5899322.1 hypothetical protein N7495_004066 [Penicillium taxi]
MAALFKINFLTIHYAYFILVSMIGSVIIYTTSKIHSLHYVDALFISVSTITGTGLNVVDLSTLNVFQQVTLFALLLLGHAIPISGIILFFRSRMFRSILLDNARGRTGRQSAYKISALAVKTERKSEEKEYAIFTTYGSKNFCDKSVSKITSEVKEVFQVQTLQDEPISFLADEVIATIDPRPTIEKYHQNQLKYSIKIDEKHQNARAYLSSFATRLKSFMQHLSERVQSRRSIDCSDPCGLEYKAITFLSILVLLYFTTILLLGIVSIGCWLKFHRPDIALADEVSPFWAGTFLATSAFVSCGMSLISDNMVPFQREPYVLLVIGFIVLAGNTLYPCILRLSIWSMRKMMPSNATWDSWRRTLDFTLAHSQIVYSYLFPSWHTWFLFGSVFILNSVMWGGFEILTIGEPAEIQSLPSRYRALDGLFQALAVRGGGFNVVSFDKLPQGLLILYLLMMYISAFPVSVVIRKSGIIPMQSLDSISQKGEESGISFRGVNLLGPSKLARSRFVYEQVRLQMSNDLWWLSCVIILITVVESGHFQSQPLAFSTFNIIFEVVSAYSCVGVSIGYPGKSYAFCGEWHTISKLLLAVVTLKGRHRGLPVPVEIATLLSGSWGWSENSEMEMEEKSDEEKEAPK